MVRVRMARSALADVPNPAASIGKWVRDMTRDLFDPYQPELHYMRGPGPKWREKHGQRPASDIRDFAAHQVCQTRS
ncbi:MAG: hypothetical protein QOF19_2252 [Alphaproteobacteria bacterium]|nr:hypothetical protein [Alphaproteobacteria bacterium]